MNNANLEKLDIVPSKTIVYFDPPLKNNTVKAGERFMLKFIILDENCNVIKSDEYYKFLVSYYHLPDRQGMSWLVNNDSNPGHFYINYPLEKTGRYELKIFYEGHLISETLTIDVVAS